MPDFHSLVSVIHWSEFMIIVTPITLTFAVAVENFFVRCHEECHESSLFVPVKVREKP